MPEELDVASACWEIFKKERAWPSAKLFARQYTQWAAPVLRSEAKWSHIQIGSEVRPDWELLFQLPETRSLLAPLPAFISAVADRVASNPVYQDDSSSRLEVTLVDLQRFWSKADDARLVADLLVRLWSPWLGHGYSDVEGVRFYPRLDSLRYQNAQTLDGLLRLIPSRDRSVEKPAKLAGPHLEFLHRIHEHLKQRGAWPEAVPFAVEHRGIGYIPDMVEPLQPAFIRRPWNGSRHARLQLTRKCIPWVTTKHERDLLVRAVRAVAQLWWEEDESNAEFDVSAGMVASALQVTESEVGPLLRYLDQEFWVRLEASDWPEAPWKLMLNDKIGRLKDVETWEGYLQAVQEYEEEQKRSIIGSLNLERIASAAGILAGPIPAPPEKGKKGGARRTKKAKPLFISHSTKDKALVDTFVELLEAGMGVPDEDIVCTSRVHQAVPVGARFPEYLRDSINDCSLFICLVSENFYASKFALCELGAAWGAKKIIVPVIVPPFGTKHLEAVLQDGLQGIDLLNAEQLASLHATVRKYTRANGDISRWDAQVRRFLKSARETLELGSTEQPARTAALETPALVSQVSASLRPTQAPPSLASPEWQTFQNLIDMVLVANKELPPVQRAAAYASGCEMNAYVLGHDYTDVYDAVNRGMIVADGDRFWAAQESRLMREAVEPFKRLKNFLEQASDQFCLEHEKRYGFRADVKTPRFAEVHIGFSWEYHTATPGEGGGDNIPF